MGEISDKEKRLIKTFLEAYRKMLNEEVNIPFNPRSLVIISQPDIRDSSKFHSIAYNKWFDEVEPDCRCGASSTLLEAFLDIPISILISAEEVGKSLVSRKDQKKLMKALRILSEIKLERQK